jgi:two-component system C4-dicarboxylate transport response regulator DctD
MPGKDFAEPAKKAARPRVLVVEDEPLLRWSIVETLVENGFDARGVGDAVSALCELELDSGGADVVLLDVYLPDSDNLGVLAAMRRMSPATPIVLMTAHGSPALVDRARRLGAFTVLDKPFELSNVAPLLECALATRLE